MDIKYILSDKKIKGKLITIALIIAIIIVFSFIYGMLTEDRYVNVADTIGPKIVRVTSSNNDGIYTINQKILINVEFNEEIVMSGENEPRLLLQLDGKTRYADYVDTGSKSILTFKYSILKGDNAKRLNYASEDSLEARGIVIKDRAGNESSLLMPLTTSENSLSGTRRIQIATDEVYPIIFEQKITDEINKYTIVFSKRVSGFTLSDITVYDGTTSNFNELSLGRIYEVYASRFSTARQSIVIKSNVCVDEDIGIPNSSSVSIPAGFYYCGGTKGSGIVITDSRFMNKQGFYTNGIVDERIVNTPGANMFVWVPVDYINDENGTLDGRTEKVLDGRFGKRQYVQYGDIASYKENVPDSIANSISKYNGFYVGRYEGVYCADGSLGSKVSVKNAQGYIGRLDEKDKLSVGALYNYLNASNAASAINKLYPQKGAVIAHLPYAAEYDTMLKWIEESGIDVNNDSSSWGNYYNSALANVKEKDVKLILETGTDTIRSAKNICDLAGNLWELTRENGVGNSVGVVRGGCYSSYGYTFPATYKTVLSDDSKATCGARPFLCME